MLALVLQRLDPHYMLQETLFFNDAILVDGWIIYKSSRSKPAFSYATIAAIKGYQRNNNTVR
jgi:hypothetical protein